MARAQRALTIEDAGARDAGVVSLPNLISFARLPLGAAFLLIERAEPRVAILVAAAASDYLDGWVARRFHLSSRSGEIIDPLTDKLFVLATLAALLRSGVFAAWEMLILLSRDAVTVLAFVIAQLLKLRVHFRARFSGKVVTTLQIATVLVATAVTPLTPVALLATGAASAWAIADYLWFGARSLRAGARAG